MNSPPAESIIDRLLSDPGAVAAVAALAKSLAASQNAESPLNTAEGTGKSTTDNTADAGLKQNSAESLAGATENAGGTTGSSPSGASAPDGGGVNGDAFSRLLSDPELIARLPQILAAAAPLLSSFGNSSQSSTPNAAGLLRAPQPVTEQQKRSALLKALKPYLSPERAEAVDYILRITELISLLK